MKYKIIYTTPSNTVLTFNNVSDYSVDGNGFFCFIDTKTNEYICVPKDRVIIKSQFEDAV